MSKFLSQQAETVRAWLEHELSKLHWPRETNVSLEVTESVTAFLDVGLPDIEDFPKRVAIVSRNGRRIHFKDKSEKALREEYARHIHGVAFRLAGGVFSILPAIKTVVASGYSERDQAQTGDVEDEYLYSVRIPRDGFSKINFSRLDHVDPAEALAAFEMRRSMTKTGIFKAIEPMTNQAPVNQPPPSVCGPIAGTLVDYGLFRVDGSSRPAADAFKKSLQ